MISFFIAIGILIFLVLLMTLFVYIITKLLIKWEAEYQEERLRRFQSVPPPPPSRLRQLLVKLIEWAEKF